MAATDQHNATPKGGKPWVKWAILGGIAVALVAFFAFGGKDLLSLATLQSNLDRLADFTQRHYWATMVVFGIIYTAYTVLFLPGASVLTLTAGFLFGRFMGTLIVLCFATLGATLVFWGARYLFGEATRAKLSGDGRVAKLVRGFEQDAVGYLLFLRLVPVFPFPLINTVPALTSISSRTYIITTAIGILPATFVYCNLGRTLPNIQSLSQLVSTEVLLSFALLGLLALMPTAVKRIYAARRKQAIVE